MTACRSDLLRERRVAWLWPAVLGIAAIGGFALPPTAGAIVAAGGFAIAGVLCVANAVQCGRTHCLATGPIYLVAAGLFWVRAAGVDIPAGWIVVGAAIGTVLAFTPEWLGRPYLCGNRERGNVA